MAWQIHDFAEGAPPGTAPDREVMSPESKALRSSIDSCSTRFVESDMREMLKKSEVKSGSRVQIRSFFRKLAVPAQVFPDAVALLRWRDRNQRMLPKLALDGIATRESTELPPAPLPKSLLTLATAPAARDVARRRTIGSQRRKPHVLKSHCPRGATQVNIRSSRVCARASAECAQERSAEPPTERVSLAL